MKLLVTVIVVCYWTRLRDAQVVNSVTVVTC